MYQHSGQRTYTAVVDGQPTGGAEERDGRRGAGSSVVLRTVLDRGPVARSTIAQVARLSPANVSRHTAALAERRLIQEVANGAAPKGVGRPHVPVDIDVRGYLVAGVHIAAHHATLALMDLRGRVVATERLPHEGGDATGVLSGIARRVPEFLAVHTRGRVPIGLGVATGGWVDPDRGVVMRNHALGWRDVPVRDVLAASLTLPVAIDGSARALARAEQLLGHARAAARSSLVHLFVGNVIDVAFATGGSVHHGPRSAAGEIGHLAVDGSTARCGCGRVGCLQATVSDRAVAQRAFRDGIVGEASFVALLAAARAGQARAVALLRERARLVGQAVALLLDVLNPEVLIVTEMGIVALPQCLADLRAEVRARSRWCTDAPHRVVPTSFAGAVLATSGAAVMLDSLYADPLAFMRVPSIAA